MGERQEGSLDDAIAWACYEAMAQVPRAQRPRVLHAFAQFSREASAALDELAGDGPR